jgi:hypothetical protein
MADNVTADPGTGGATFKTDEDTGASAHVPVTKIELGANNTFDGYVASGNPMPVEISDGTNTIAIAVEDVATPATINGVPVMMERDDALATLTPIEGDWVSLRSSAEGALWVQEFNSDAILADTASMDTNLGTIAGAVSGTEMQVDLVSANVTNAGTFAVQVDGAALTALQLIDDPVATDDTTTHATGTTKVMGIGAVATPTDGSVDANDIGMPAMSVDRRLHTDAQIVGQDAALDVSGATVTVDLGANNDVTVTGGNAHDGTTLGNPVLAGARATNSVEGITQVANADLTHVQADLNGVLLSRPHTTPEEHISERVSDTAGNSTNFTNFNAGGAGIHNYVCDVTITNTSATDGYVDLRDGSAGSVIWTFPAPANSGATHSFSLPLKGAANTALAYDVSAALTTVYIAVNGFQAQG